MTFHVDGVDYTHLTERFRRACLSNILREALSDDVLNIRVTFNRRSISNIWHHWLYFHKIASRDDLMRVGCQDVRGAGLRTLHEYFDLLSCLFLGQVLGDSAFTVAVAITNKIKDKLAKGKNQAILLACFQEEIMRNIFSLFDPGSPVPALLVDAMVKYGTVGDIEYRIKSHGYPREYAVAVILQSFNKLQRFKKALVKSAMTSEGMVRRGLPMDLDRIDYSSPERSLKVYTLIMFVYSTRADTKIERG
jgi:hypothetical protein